MDTLQLEAHAHHLAGSGLGCLQLHAGGIALRLHWHAAKPTALQWTRQRQLQPCRSAAGGHRGTPCGCCPGSAVTAAHICQAGTHATCGWRAQLRGQSGLVQRRTCRLCAATSNSSRSAVWGAACCRRFRQRQCAPAAQHTTAQHGTRTGQHLATQPSCCCATLYCLC
jgi:hypothetical protein